jgi:thiol:disulfide interchange protein
VRDRQPRGIFGFPLRHMSMRAALLFLCVAEVFGQGQQHAVWTLGTEPASAAPGAVIEIRASAQIDPGWHLYSASSAVGLPAAFQVAPESLVRVLQPPPKRAFDTVLNGESETYENAVAFLLEVKLRADAPAGPEPISVSVRYQTCNDKTCVPGKWSGRAAVTIDPALPKVAAAIPAGYEEAKPAAVSAAPTGADQSWPTFLLVAFGFGLACIFTPCVFPMIPITMSYFLNRQSGGRRESVVQAVVFCLGIIVLFTGLGLLASALLGPIGVKQLGSNPWVNGFISALFILFGLSLLGAFEITIPSSILTRLNQASGTGGFGGTLLMGLTFSLSSFACVGPFVGTLLAASVGGGRARPLFGMAFFSAGLALPFFFLALFPSYLKRMPRAGGWMSRVKIVMGFLVLAFSLKYLSGVDQVLQWGFLTRERFLAAWIVLFAMAGLYLLGFLRLEGIKAEENLGLGRLLTGLALLIFAISLWPGMSGGKLGWLDAFVPAGEETAATPSSGLAWMKDQYRDALDRARAEHKLVFIDFTGYACANCHWMRSNILNRAEVAAVLKDFVLVELYTDGNDAASQANSKLQLDKFGTVALPFYVILDADEKLVAKYEGLTHNPAEYLAFLQKAQAPAAAAPAASGMENSSPAPTGNFPQITRLDGGAFDTSGLAGKVVVVNFWATYCIPCISEFPAFNKLHHDFAGKGVAVIGVDMDEDQSRVPGFLKKHPLDYAVGLGWGAANEKYQLEALPVTLIYDRTGKQVSRFEGNLKEPELLAAVQKAL